MSEIKVQIVEDEAFTAEYIKEMLINLGYAVSSVVDSGRKAIEFAGRDKPDVILMDICLEGDIDGIETAKAIHSQYEIPVIFITAQDSSEIIDRAKKANPYGFLIKAFEERDLKVSIEMALHTAYADAMRKKAEKALRESEERLNAFLDSATDIFFLFNADLHLVMVNTAGLALFPPGTMKEDIIGVYIENLLPADFKAGRIEHFREVIRSGVPHFSGDIEALSLLGNTFINIKAFKAADGLGLIVRDITKRKNAEKEKEKLKTLLIDSQKTHAIGALAEGIAHDFSNLLHVISGNAELLIEKAGMDKKTELSDITDAVRKGSELIQQLLTFSRKGEGSFTILNLNDEISRLHTLLKRVIPKMIEIRLELDPELVATAFDPAQMEQVLMNLCIRAKDAMPDGGRLTITTANQIVARMPAERNLPPDIQPGRYAVLTISDTGSGIDAALVNRIFDPSFSTKNTEEGEGIDLSVAYGIIASHGGRLFCDSHPNQGTVFSIYLPEDKSAELFDSPDSVETDSAKSQGFILVVDDEENVLHLTTAMLERLNYQTITADSGEAAMDIYIDRKDEIDLVLLDLNMPGMGGQRCLQRILMINPSARVIIASGYLKEGLTEALLKDGAKACLVKPYSKFELSRAIYSVLTES